MTQSMQLDENIRKSQPKNSVHLPVNVPLCLQYKEWFLCASPETNNVYCTKSVSRNNLFLVTLCSKKQRVAIQSMAMGQFLDSNSLAFNIYYMKEERLFKFCARQGGIFFTREEQNLVVDSNGSLELVSPIGMYYIWKLVFPGIPLLKHLSYEWSLLSTSSTRNQLPYNTPLYVQSYKHTYLGMEQDTQKARCITEYLFDENQIVLRRVNNETVAIQLRSRETFLSVHPNGKCGFTNDEVTPAELFWIEVDDQANVFFISCSNGKVMQCDVLGDANCANSNRLEWEQWKLILACACNPSWKPNEKLLDQRAYCA